MKRFFYFLLSFFVIIGGTLATAEAASVEAVQSVADDGISVTSIDTDNGSETTTFTSIIFFDSSVSPISSLSNISTYTQITVPAGTAYMALYFSLDAFSFNGISTVTLSSRSYAGYNIVKVNLFFRANSSESYTSSSSTQIFDKALTDAFQFEMYYSNTNYMVLDVHFDEVTASSVTMYAPNITFSTGSSDDLEETNNLISTSNGFLSNILSTLTSLPQTIIDLFISAMKSLFVPSDDYFSTKFNSLYETASDKLGILIIPFDILQELVNVLTSADSDFIIEFPAFTLTISGSAYQVWDSYTFNLSDLIEGDFATLYNYLHIVTDVLLVGWFISFLYRTYEKAIEGSEDT